MRRSPGRPQDGTTGQPFPAARPNRTATLRGSRPRLGTGVRGGGWGWTPGSTFIPVKSISWQKNSGNFVLGACNPAQHCQNKKGTITGNGVRRPCPFASAPARKTMDGTDRRGASCVRLARGRTGAIRRANRAAAKRAPTGAGARAHNARIRVPPHRGPGRRRQRRHLQCSPRSARRRGKRTEDRSRGEPDAENRKPGNPNGIPGPNE